MRLAVIFLIVYLLSHFSLDEEEEDLYSATREQILLDRITRLQSFYNADGLRICGLDNRSTSPGQSLVWFIVFWLCVRHLSHAMPLEIRESW